MIENGHPQFEPEPPPHSQWRETMLALLLIVAICVPLMALLFAASLGVLAYIPLIALGMGLFALLNYFLWGRRFSRGIEAERRRLEEADQAAEDWRTATKPPWERRF